MSFLAASVNFHTVHKMICVGVQVLCEQGPLYQSCTFVFLVCDGHRRHNMEKIRQKGLSWTQKKIWGQKEEEPFLLAPSTLQMCDSMSVFLHWSLQIHGCDFSELNMFEGEVEQALAGTNPPWICCSKSYNTWQLRQVCAVSLESI